MPSFRYQNKIIEYSLSRNAKKNVNFRIKNNGEICISAPKRVSKIELEKMILAKANWLITNQEKILSKNKHIINTEIKNGIFTFINGNKYIIKIIPGSYNNISFSNNILILQIKENYIASQKYINNYFENWLKKITYEQCDKLIDKYLIALKNYNLKKPELTIRTMKSRWGSCIPTKGKITINKNLIYSPYECLEYVVLHEISHLIEANHSKNFYNIIEKIMPDWKKRKKILNDF